jgi:hypothetical protein
VGPGELHIRERNKGAWAADLKIEMPCQVKMRFFQKVLEQFLIQKYP